MQRRPAQPEASHVVRSETGGQKPGDASQKSFRGTDEPPVDKITRKHRSIGETLAPSSPPFQESRSPANRAQITSEARGKRDESPRTNLSETVKGGVSAAPAPKASPTVLGSSTEGLGTTKEGTGRKASKLLFSVSPEDASVYVDSVFIGNAKSLASGIELQDGSHIVLVKRDGYRSRRFTVAPAPGSVMTLYASLVTTPAVARDHPPTSVHRVPYADAQLLRGRRVNIVCGQNGCAAASQLKGRLETAGAICSLRISEPAERRRFSTGIYFPSRHLLTARAAGRVLEDLRHLSLYMNGRSEGSIDIWILD